MPPVPALPAPGVKTSDGLLNVLHAAPIKKNEVAICVRCLLSTTNIFVQISTGSISKHLGQACNGGLVSNRSNRFQSLVNNLLAWALQSETPFPHVLELAMAIETDLVRAIMASTLL